MIMSTTPKQIDPIIAHRTCSCCPNLVGRSETYIISELKREWPDGTKTTLTSCIYCGNLNRRHYEYWFNQADEQAQKMHSWIFIEFRTSDGKPLRKWVDKNTDEVITGPQDI